MNTVADKLMKLVQTKSDIRQALLDKGFNVPDTMPFSGYADLIRRFPCNVKDFPDIPGMIARWSAKGLTNEDMSTNPVWKDLTGNGHDLQMKNFGWAGMSGVGGYNQNFNRWGYGNVTNNGASQTHTSSKVNLNIPPSSQNVNIYSNAFSLAKEGDIFNFTINVSGLKDGVTLTVAKGVSGIIKTIESDGIYTIYQEFEDGWDQDRIYIKVSNILVERNITIEQLPFYPDSIVFDGVDDYGICDNFPILTKEKGYTVVALRSIIDKNIPGYLLSNSAGSNQGAFIFERTIDSLTVSFGKGSPITVNYNNPLTYQTTSKYNQKSISVGELLEGGKSLVVGRNSKESNLYANFAIWELVILDHDATEEELQKIQDYYKQQYPWLFPDQAWTVVGKTNEDTDRATIANITGNGNNLVLGNFGFAENSGYGLYGTNYTTWTNANRATYTVSSDKIHVTKVYSEPESTFIYGNGLTKLIQKIKVTGLPQGVKLRIGRTELWTHEIATDGIYNIEVADSSESPLIGYNIDTLLESCDITIEQIPDYEGYLVTDGVDDKIQSSNFSMGRDWTIVGEWEFIQKENVDAGVSKVRQIYFYNSSDGTRVNINSVSALTDINVNKILGATGDGVVYNENWDITEVQPGSVLNSNSALQIGHINDIGFTKLAFKNFAIYGAVLSKEDCIKAYNYLQTLKS